MEIVTLSSSGTSSVVWIGSDGVEHVQCLRGHVHRGPHAKTAALRCDCPHDAPLWDWLDAAEVHHLICSACGKDFWSEPHPEHAP